MKNPITFYQEFSDDKINEFVKKAESNAKDSIEILGMRLLLEKHKLWGVLSR